jgi:ATP-dependent DNA helicase RecQ
MAARRPRNEEEFAAVNGVGAAKLHEFAAPFLTAIAAHDARILEESSPHLSREI